MYGFDKDEEEASEDIDEDMDMEARLALSGSFNSTSGSFRRRRGTRPSTPDPIWTSMRLPSPRVRRKEEDASLAKRRDGAGGGVDGGEYNVGLDVMDLDAGDKKIEPSLKIGWINLLALNKPEAIFIAFGCVASLLTGGNCEV